jgi:hypothetical protein
MLRHVAAPDSPSEEENAPPMLELKPTKIPITTKIQPAQISDACDQYDDDDCIEIIEPMDTKYNIYDMPRVRAGKNQSYAERGYRVKEEDAARQERKG